jgi:hypothetical protein
VWRNRQEKEDCQPTQAYANACFPLFVFIRNRPNLLFIVIFKMLLQLLLLGTFEFRVGEISATFWHLRRKSSLRDELRQAARGHSGQSGNISGIIRADNQKHPETSGYARCCPGAVCCGVVLHREAGRAARLAPARIAAQSRSNRFGGFFTPRSGSSLQNLLLAQQESPPCAGF